MIEIEIINEHVEKLSSELRRGLIVLVVMSQLESQQYGYSLLRTLEEKGFEISADQVGLDGPIKVTGFYSIPIRLFEGAEGKVDITVDRG